MLIDIVCAFKEPLSFSFWSAACHFLGMGSFLSENDRNVVT